MKAGKIFFSITIVLLSLTCSPVLSEGIGEFSSENEALALFACQSDSASDTENFLKKIQDAYTKVLTLKASFEQYAYLPAADIWQHEVGVVSFQKASDSEKGAMKWDYREPTQQEFLIRENTIYHYQPELKQLVRGKFRDLMVSDVPLAFLMGVGSLTNSFTLQEACSSRGGLVARLIPRARDSGSEVGGAQNMKEFVLLVDSKLYLPAGAIVRSVGGQENVILFRQREINEGVTHEDFEALFPRGIDIIDR